MIMQYEKKSLQWVNGSMVLFGLFNNVCMYVICMHLYKYALVCSYVVMYFCKNVIKLCICVLMYL